METVITERTGQHAYPLVIEHVLKAGRTRAPRGRTTLDAGMVIIHLNTPYSALPLGCGRDLNRNIAAAETVQLVGGFTNPALLLQASPNFARYLDGDAFHGAYGQRIGTQMISVRKKLSEDASTRQAIVTLWDPWRDNLPDMRDYPCTVALHFEVAPELDQLCMTTIMRSNDVWLGLPYDMFQFTQLQLTLARSLDIGVGWYRHVALSMHIYSEHVVTAEQKIHRPTDFSVQPSGFGQPGMGFKEMMSRAVNVTTNRQNENETASEGWYRERFASYMGRDVDEHGNGGSGTVAL